VFLIKVKKFNGKYYQHHIKKDFIKEPSIIIAMYKKIFMLVFLG